jgi:3-methyladenine DNA glycosylase AlkD
MAATKTQSGCAGALAELKRLGTKATRDGMARYAIPSDKAFGVPVGVLRKLGKQLGPSHELAAELWDSGWYEARMLAIFVDEVARVTPAQMDRWCRDFDNWAICDTACFHLFDHTPHAFAKVELWSKKKGEFSRRASFALLASLALHDKLSPDAPFLACFPLIEAAATDERNFVKKAVSWALRGIGARNPVLHASALELAQRLAQSADMTTRWIGKDTLRDLNRPLLAKRFAAQKKRAARAKA